MISTITALGSIVIFTLPIAVFAAASSATHRDGEQAGLRQFYPGVARA
jgi:hypothetical protein